MSRERITEIWTNDGDTAFDAVYEIEPFNPGGRDEPPSGGYAYITEIRHKDGSKLADDSWQAAGFPPKHIEQLEESIFNDVCDRDQARKEASDESSAEARRERRLMGEE